jgi:hypothetical protein
LLHHKNCYLTSVSSISSIGQLQIGDDPVLALGAAAILLLTTQMGGDQMVFAREEISKLTVQVLQVNLVEHPFIQ